MAITCIRWLDDKCPILENSKETTPFLMDFRALLKYNEKL